MSEEKVLEEEQKQDPVESCTEAPVDGETPAPEDCGGQVSGDEIESEKEDSASSELTREIETLKEENEKLKDQYLRKAADFENYRKRVIKEKQEAIDYANSNILLDMIGIIDDFERAIKAGDETSDVAAFKDGIVMIKDKLVSVLDSKYGLTGYDSLNTPFNPEIHEALGRVVDPGVKEPLVGEEYLRGYRLKDRVIRSAKVMVKMPGNPEEKPEETKDKD